MRIEGKRDGRTDFGSLVFFIFSFCSFFLSLSVLPVHFQSQEFQSQPNERSDYEIWGSKTDGKISLCEIMQIIQHLKGLFVAQILAGLAGVLSAQRVNDWLQRAKHSNSDIRVLAASTNHGLSCSPKPPACLRLLWRHSMLSHFPCKLSSLVWLPPVFPVNWLNCFGFISPENCLFPLKTSNDVYRLLITWGCSALFLMF